MTKRSLFSQCFDYAAPTDVRAREVATTHSFEAAEEAKVDNSFNERDKLHFI